MDDSILWDDDVGILETRVNQLSQVFENPANSRGWSRAVVYSSVSAGQVRS